MTSVAIIGLDTYFGACRDGRAFARAVAHGLRCEATPDALCGVELALRVADNALFDADVTRGARMAVLWAGDAPAAAEIVALWSFSGPATDAPDSVTALTEAQHLLVSGAVDAALVGETGAAGGVALVLTRAGGVTGRVYAIIEKSGTDIPVCPQAGKPALQSLPGYWEWPALAEGNLPAAAHAPEPTCALGSVQTNLGDAAPALAALARTALCLYHRVIPATPDYRGPREPQPDSPFYVAPAAQPWLVEGELRIANCELRITKPGVLGTVAVQCSMCIEGRRVRVTRRLGCVELRAGCYRRRRTTPKPAENTLPMTNSANAPTSTALFARPLAGRTPPAPGAPALG